MSNPKAQARYEAKRPRLTYRSELELVEDLQALRTSFESDQEMMSYLVHLGLAAHCTYHNMYCTHDNAKVSKLLDLLSVFTANNHLVNKNKLKK